MRLFVAVEIDEAARRTHASRPRTRCGVPIGAAESPLGAAESMRLTVRFIGLTVDDERAPAIVVR
jgi:hypothetical protein